MESVETRTFALMLNLAQDRMQLYVGYIAVCSYVKAGSSGIKRNYDFLRLPLCRLSKETAFFHSNCMLKGFI